MTSNRISRRDQAPHCGSAKSRSRPVTRLNNAPQPAVSGGRLSRKDVIFTPGAIVRSSSADRRLIGTCSIPRQVASRSRSAGVRLSRRDIGFMPCSFERSASTDRRYCNTSQISRPLRKIASEGHLSRRDAGFTLGAMIRSSSSDRRNPKSKTMVKLYRSTSGEGYPVAQVTASELKNSPYRTGSPVPHIQINNNAKGADALKNVTNKKDKASLFERILSKFSIKFRKQKSNKHSRKSQIPIATWQIQAHQMQTTADALESGRNSLSSVYLAPYFRPEEVDNSPDSLAVFMVNNHLPVPRQPPTSSEIPNSSSSRESIASSEMSSWDSSGSRESSHSGHSALTSTSDDSDHDDLNNHCPDETEESATLEKKPRKHIMSAKKPRHGERENDAKTEPPDGASTTEVVRKDLSKACADKELLEEYMRLVRQNEENETKINSVEGEIEQQERDIETLLEKNVAHQKNLELSTRTHAETFKIHKNFMDEATRVRVESKEQEISADILKDNVEEIKDEIRILCDKIDEIKERRALGVHVLVDDTAEMKLMAGQMEMENNELDVETDARRDEFNAIRIEMKELGIEHPRSSSTPILKFDGSTPLPALKGGAGSPPPPVRRLSEHGICVTTLKSREPIASRSLSKISRKSPSPRNGNQPIIDEELKLDNKNTEDQMTNVAAPTRMRRSRSPSASPTRRNTAFVFEMSDGKENNTPPASSVAKKRQAMLNKMKEREQKRGKNDAPKSKFAVEEISTKPVNEEYEYSANKIPPQSRAQLVTVLELQCSESRHNFISRVPEPVHHLQWSAKRDPVRLVPSDKKRGNVMQRKDYCRLDFLNEEEVLHPGLYGTWVSMRKDEVYDDDTMGIDLSSRQQYSTEATSDTFSHTDTIPKRKREKKVLRSKINHGQYGVKKAAPVNKVKINHAIFQTKKPIVSRINHGQFYVEKSEIVNTKLKINHDIFQTKKPICSKINHGQFSQAKKLDPVKIQINHGSYKTNKASSVTSKINHGQFDAKKSTKADKPKTDKGPVGKTKPEHHTTKLQKKGQLATKANASSTKASSPKGHGLLHTNKESDVKSTTPKRVAQQQSMCTNKDLNKNPLSVRLNTDTIIYSDAPTKGSSVSKAKGLHATPLPPIKTPPRTPLSSARTPLPPIKSSSKLSSTTQSRPGSSSSTISSNRKLPPISPRKHLFGDQNYRVGRTKEGCKISSPLPPLPISARFKQGDYAVKSTKFDLPPVTSPRDIDIKDLQSKPKEGHAMPLTKIPRPIQSKNHARRRKVQKSTTDIGPEHADALTDAADIATSDADIAFSDADIATSDVEAIEERNEE